MTFSLFGDEMEEVDDAAPSAEEGPAPAAAPTRTLPPVQGHAQAEQFLWQTWQAGRMPHGLMLAGTQGIGKALFAQHMAAFLLSPPSFRASAQSLMAHDAGTASRIIARTHPDFLYVGRLFDDNKGRADDEIKVKEIRKIAPFLRSTATTQDGWRVVIVDDADTMNREAQNSILKILEEPPERAVLMLVTHRPGAFLPTIRSRCQVVSFQPLDDALFRNMARNLYPDATPDLVSMAAGRPGYLATLMEADFQGAWNDLTAILAQWPRLDPLALHRFADKMSAPECNDQLHLLSGLWVGALAACAKAAACEEALPSYLERAGGPWPGLAAAGKPGVAALVRLHDEMKAHWDAVFWSTLERRTAILKAFVTMKALAPAV